ncbi:MAG: rhamnulokinase family protein [Planctomycetota bacterium]
MAELRHYIAVDLGAESGRVMLGAVSPENMVLTEAYRFSNEPIKVDKSLRWDFNKMFSQIKKGISEAARQCDKPLSGIGVDSWGVDFGLIGDNGRLLENPYHYRDSRTNGIMAKAFELMPKRQIYNNTGLQFMQLNTIYQLLSMRLADSQVLTKAAKLLFTADLVSYHLCGELFAEYTLSSTSQLMDMAKGIWSEEIFQRLSLPLDIMPSVVQAGTVVGTVKENLADEMGCGLVPVIAVASHDTGCAVAAVPAGTHNWAYISSGTWSLMGIETTKAIITDKTFEYEFTNEGGVSGTIRLLKNIMGLWLVQECRRQWQRDGDELSYDQLTAMAQKSEPFAAYIDPSCADFLAPGDMPSRINQYLAKTAQRQINDKGLMVRAILESLAFVYRQVMEQIEDISGEKIDVLHIVGGGIKNRLLCQFAANATGKKVLAGPVEATAGGNIIIQAMACGRIKSLSQARELVRNSFEVTEYLPADTAKWTERYAEIS